MKKNKFRQPLKNGNFIEWFYWGFIDGEFVSPALALSGMDDTRHLSQQFINQHDKNNVEIYEGDFIRFGWNPILHDESEIYKFTEQVVYDIEWTCFVVIITSRSGEIQKINVGRLVLQSTNPAEVVGNVFENPELLDECTTKSENTQS